MASGDRDDQRPNGTAPSTAAPPSADGPSTPEDTASSGRRRVPRGVIVGATVVAVIVAVLGVYGAVLWSSTDRVPVTLAGSADDGTTYLLIGSDERGNVPAAELDRFGTTAEVPGRRADIVLAVRVMDDGSVRVLGIPRDLTIFPTGQGPGRIAPMLEDGPGAIADGLCHSLGIGVDHTVVVDFAGLADLVDMAGGVEVTSDVALRDPMSGLELPAGTTRLDGSEAIAYVRARTIESELDGTWAQDAWRSGQRTQRAMDVLEGLSGALELSWTHPLRANTVLRTTAGAVQVDDGAGPGDLMGLRSGLGGIDRSDLMTLPVVEQDGPVPNAALAPAAGVTIEEFLGRDHDPACSTPALLSPG